MVDYNNINYKNIAIVSNQNSYQYILDNILPLYSNFWIYNLNDSLDNTINMKLKTAIETNDIANIIIFGIQNYSKITVKSNRILILDGLIRNIASTMPDHANKIVALSIQNFVMQWQSIDRIPGTNNWMNNEWSKKGGIYQLL